VAISQDRVIGDVLLSEIAIVDELGTAPALSLAPLAVRPEHQRAGIGSALVRSALEKCVDAHYAAVIVIGDQSTASDSGFP
jgi:putative acetyltransferase